MRHGTKCPRIAEPSGRPRCIIDFVQWTAMTSVVIVGSGFTGFECARSLHRKLRKHNAPVDISIISPVDYMLYTPLLPDVAGGVVDARFVAIPLANTLRGVQAIRGRVDGVDFDAHTLMFTDPEERSRSLSWDRLVLTPGSVTRLFDMPGLADTRARAEVDRRGAIPARPRARAARVGRCRRRSRPRGGTPDDRGRRRVVLGNRTGRAASGARRFGGQADGLRPRQP